MKKEDLTLIVGAAIIAAIFSIIVSGLVFSAPTRRGDKVPVVESIDSSFPDVKQDPAYTAFFNSGALDPTQPIQIGGTKNTSPFQ